MKVLEGEVRKITMDGLLWGACKYLILCSTEECGFLFENVANVSILKGN